MTTESHVPSGAPYVRGADDQVLSDRVRTKQESQFLDLQVHLLQIAAMTLWRHGRTRSASPPCRLYRGQDQDRCKAKTLQCLRYVRWVLQCGGVLICGIGNDECHPLVGKHWRKRQYHEYQNQRKQSHGSWTDRVCQRQFAVAFVDGPARLLYERPVARPGSPGRQVLEFVH
jgi:hypothetical protein